ncbi:hypothetical protein DDE18_11905 [Nocardioides gansuensis]|uniref:Uncharacterized protein n=1 Tax=Nocardioides gansuensis TaxID=2138300 RepID=A0A2T8F8Z4_9ACTN|nr:hypothetical protein DDE18_11905 [Nocardioides gansuensis]
MIREVLPIIVFVWLHLLTRRTPMGRKQMQAVRSPALRGSGSRRSTSPNAASRWSTEGCPRCRPTGDRCWMTDGCSTSPTASGAPAFRQTFDWMDVPIVGDDGWRREYRGVVDSAPGLFFYGLSFQYALSSMVLPGVGRDAT